MHFDAYLVTRHALGSSRKCMHCSCTVSRVQIGWVRADTSSNRSPAPKLQAIPIHSVPTNRRIWTRPDLKPKKALTNSWSCSKDGTIHPLRDLELELQRDLVGLQPQTRKRGARGSASSSLSALHDKACLLPGRRELSSTASTTLPEVPHLGGRPWHASRGALLVVLEVLPANAHRGV